MFINAAIAIQYITQQLEMQKVKYQRALHLKICQQVIAVLYATEVKKALKK
jgi:hypothetical protein